MAFGRKFARLLSRLFVAYSRFWLTRINPAILTSLTITCALKSLGKEKTFGLRKVLISLCRFDIMLDQKLKPWLIEVNHTPSFTTDTPLDKNIKKNCIADALKLMNINVEDKVKAKNLKRVELQQRVLTGKKIKPTAEEKQAAFERAQKERTAWEAVNHGRYEKIYPFDVSSLRG